MSEQLDRTRPGGLTSFVLPKLAFNVQKELTGTLRSIWDLLAQGNHRLACERALQALSATPSGAADERAALYLAVGAAAFGSGNNRRAMTAAQESVRILSRQWAAHRLQIQVYLSERDFENAYFYLSTIPDPATSYEWDEPLSAEDRHAAIAALAWRLQDWEGVADHLKRAYPGGVASMPVSFREDLFRVSVYREDALDATEAARALLPAYDVEETDQMLATMDSRGWTNEALQLYREAFERDGKNPLLRRRLVGLCIRQGRVDEARSLTQGAALDMAA